MAQDWLWMSAADLGRGIGAREIDPVALAQAYLDAIAAHAQAPDIYARLTPDRALAEAEAAARRAKHGQRRGPLDGVPISWKDLFDTAGVATEAGTALLKGRVPDRDARVGRDAVLALAAEHHHDARSVVGLERQHRRLGVEATLSGAVHPACQSLLVGGEIGG